MIKFLNKNNKRAFTLIEMIVAVGLFSIVMMVALAIILSVVDNNKKVHSVNVVVNNLNFSIDSMVRDIKTGVYYRCGASNLITISDTSSCGPGAREDIVTLVSTISSLIRIVQYEFVPVAGTNPGKIVKRSCPASDDGVQVTCNGTWTPSDLTSNEIDVTSAKFIINPGVAGSAQPTVFLQISGTSAINPTEASDFRIQTLISQRNLNI